MISIPFYANVHDKIMLIYVIMTSFRNHSPISTNYAGSNHFIYCTVEGNYNTLVL